LSLGDDQNYFDEEEENTSRNDVENRKNTTKPSTVPNVPMSKAIKLEQARDLLKEAFDIPEVDLLKISRNLERIFLESCAVRREIPIPPAPEVEPKEEDNDDESKLVEELGDAAFETLVENSQPDEIMNDDVLIEGYEKNDSDIETSEINNCLKSKEKNDPIDQISNESKAAMVNECVEKLVSPQVLAMNYNKKPVEELGDAVETLVVLPTSTMKPIKVTLKDQDVVENDETNQEDIKKAIEENDEEIKEVAEEAKKEEAEVEDQAVVGAFGMADVLQRRKKQEEEEQKEAEASSSSSDLFIFEAEAEASSPTGSSSRGRRGGRARRSRGHRGGGAY